LPSNDGNDEDELTGLRMPGRPTRSLQDSDRLVFNGCIVPTGGSRGLRGEGLPRTKPADSPRTDARSMCRWRCARVALAQIETIHALSPPDICHSSMHDILTLLADVLNESCPAYSPGLRSPFRLSPSGLCFHADLSSCPSVRTPPLAPTPSTPSAVMPDVPNCMGLNDTENMPGGSSAFKLPNFPCSFACGDIKSTSQTVLAVPRTVTF
jgi:hypothetical protein